MPSAPSQPKTGLVKRRFTGKREILPVLPDLAPGQPEQLRHDARTLLACATQHAEHWQLHKDQWQGQSGLSRRRFNAARRFLEDHQFVSLLTVRDSRGFRGSVYTIDLNGQVDATGWVLDYRQAVGQNNDFGRKRRNTRNLICRQRAGCLDATMPDIAALDEAQGVPELVGSAAAPLYPYNDELISEEKEEPLTPAKQGDVSFFEENQTTGLPAELQAQLDEAMAEAKDLITDPAVRRDAPLSTAQEIALLARHYAGLLQETQQEGAVYPEVTSTDGARSLREAYRKYDIPWSVDAARHALVSDANRAARPVEFLMASLTLRRYPAFNPGFAELGLWQETGGTDAWLMGKVAIDRLVERKQQTKRHLRGADAVNWLHHSLPGRLILAGLAPDQELSIKEAGKLCRQFARGTLSLEKAARFWMLRLRARRGRVLADDLCDSIHRAIAADDVYDPLLGITEEWMRAYCGEELVPVNGLPSLHAALTFDHFDMAGWDLADLARGLAWVARRADVWREDANIIDREMLLRVLVLRQQMPDGSATVRRIDELLVQIGHAPDRYQRWLVETPHGRRTFVAAMESGQVSAAVLQAAVGMDDIEHRARVRLLAAMCEASIAALRGAKL